MKKRLCCCGLYQDKKPSLPYKVTVPKEPNEDLSYNKIQDICSPTTTPNADMDTSAENQNQTQWYTTLVGAVSFTLPVRYQDLKTIGQGAFGAVIRATDTQTGKYVAIKKMLRPFQSKVYAKRTYRELKLLMHLNHQDADVIQLYDVFTPEKDVNDFQTLYFVFNYTESDLNRIIKRHEPMPEEHIRQIVYSLLRGLKYIHSAGIVHRDIKPANIGADRHLNITILDFGLARVVSDGLQTGYVATRWWRAPEVLIAWEQYDVKLDIWSVGCIMAELILLRPVFRGTDYIDQLKKIFEVVGTPDTATLNELCTPEALIYVSQWEVKPRKDFQELFGFKYSPEREEPISGVSPTGIDLLEHLLSFDSRLRPTAEEALKHQFFGTYHDPEDEPTRELVLDEHRDAEHSRTTWKSIIWQMINGFTPPTWASQISADG